jgi:D-glycero-alpha-D-manno-heptose-7-phosphate kinase
LLYKKEVKMRTIKKVMAPVRIDFAGGTTDISPFKDKYGGCVLNAAINKYISGSLLKSDKKVSLEYHGNIPTNSGLGTSGVMNLVWLALISEEKNKKKLAEEVYDLEQSLGQVGGKQDQYAGAFGGINFLEFNKDKVKITRLNLPEKLIKELENNLVLVYTGKPHFSGSSNKIMIDNLKKGKNIKNLLRIKQIAIEMKNALLKEDLRKFAELMNEETKERNLLHKNTIPAQIENVIRQGRENGAIAAKVCGSGNGGSILFFGNKKKLKKKFGKSVIDFKFDFKGLRWM